MSQAHSPVTATDSKGAVVRDNALPLVLAPDHQGMRVDYRGMLRQGRDSLSLGQKDPGLAEMVRQLEAHLEELGKRWYAGDPSVVDEFLQLYCIEAPTRGALMAAASSRPAPPVAAANPRQRDFQLADVLHTATSALYFADNSDYRGALRTVVTTVDPKIAELLDRDERAAVDETMRRLEAAQAAVTRAEPAVDAPPQIDMEPSNG